MRAMTMISGDTVASARNRIDLLITPTHHGVGLLEFHQIDAMTEAGRQAAAAALDLIGGPAGLYDAAAGGASTVG